jgi:hypothetical protein
MTKVRLYFRGLAALATLSVVGVGCGSAMIGATPQASIGDMPSKGPVGATMKANSGKFVACARDAVSVQVGTTQQIQLRFTVAPDGHVEKANTESMSSPDPDLRVCVLKALTKIQFPSPADKKPKDIRYPLILKP